mmetsp:Transcript_10016/g.16495  ORF Transcript_10016/g.16495 Transcript_10016/m.16495 type:complete len:285 (-) Transcript_10016:126-980(-)
MLRFWKTDSKQLYRKTNMVFLINFQMDKIHRPCCGGACLVAYTGWDNLTPVTLCMLLIPSALWFFFYGKDVSEKICPILPVLLVIIVSLTLILLLLIMFTEPGILPTVTFEEYNEEDPNVPVRIISRIVLDGREYELKEFRARFSRYTGNCIESFDHFCGWTGAAIGKRNYRYFVIFLGLCLFLAIGLAGSCTALIVIKADEQNIALWKAIKNSLGETLLAIYGYVMLLSLIGLFGFHLRAIATNQTTNEILKATYGRGVNPYDQVSDDRKCREYSPVESPFSS